jgi:hypothetical protein
MCRRARRLRVGYVGVVEKKTVPLRLKKSMRAYNVFGNVPHEFYDLCNVVVVFAVSGC